MTFSGGSIRQLALLAAIVWALLTPGSGWAGLYTCLNERRQVVFTNAPRGEQCQPVEDGAGRSRLATLPPLGGERSLMSARRQGSRKDDGSFDEYIREAGRRHRLDPLLIKAVIRAESDFDVLACSRSGARGLMQLMPDTARDMRVLNVHDPRQNIDGGSRYLRVLLDTFEQDLTLSLAAYNAGPERVLSARSIPPIPETQRYVRKVLELYRSSTFTQDIPAPKAHVLRLHRLVTVQ